MASASETPFQLVNSNPESPGEASNGRGQRVVCGLDCADLTTWRGNNMENVTAWKAVSTVCFLGWMYVLYFTILGFASVLGIVGIVFTVKAIIEIWGQNTPTWIRPANWKFFLVIYCVGFPSFVYTLALAATFPVDIYVGSDPDRDRIAVGLLLYLFGSIYSLSYEMHRFWFKSKPENKGKLHTTFLASLCIHPNYFGDFFTYTGWALVIGNQCALGNILLILPDLVFFICPNSDAYLLQRYPEEFPPYASRTATLVPFVYSLFALKVIGFVCLAAGINFCTTCPWMF